MGEKNIREKCSNVICEMFYPKRQTVLFMDDYGAWSDETGHNVEIWCQRCGGRRVVYVGSRNEKKSDVERKGRKLWHLANERVE